MRTGVQQFKAMYVCTALLQATEIGSCERDMGMTRILNTLLRYKKYEAYNTRVICP